MCANTWAACFGRLLWWFATGLVSISSTAISSVLATSGGVKTKGSTSNCDTGFEECVGNVKRQRGQLGSSHRTRCCCVQPRRGSETIQGTNVCNTRPGVALSLSPSLLSFLVFLPRTISFCWSIALLVHTSEPTALTSKPKCMLKSATNPPKVQF